MEIQVQHLLNVLNMVYEMTCSSLIEHGEAFSSVSWRRINVLFCSRESSSKKLLGVEHRQLLKILENMEPCLYN